MPSHPSRIVRLLSLLLLPALAGCITTERDLADQAIALPPDCAPGVCTFRNAPLRLLPEPIRIPGRAYEFNRLAEALEFLDSTSREWVAPRRTLTDGASIPEIFVPIVGNPREPEFTHAAALHDAYCGIGNEDGPVYQSRTWQEVHRLLYDALIAGGTEPQKAKVMFAAVWLGGPRWYRDGRPDVSVATIPKDILVSGMKSTQAFIKAKKPDMPRLLRYLRWLEVEMRREADRRADRDSATFVPEDPTGVGILNPPPNGGGSQPAVQP